MHRYKRIIDNHIYVMKLIRKGSRWFPFLLILFSIMRGINVFMMTTYLYQYVLNSLQEGEELLSIFLAVGGMSLFSLFYNIVLQYKNVAIEITSYKIEKQIQKTLQDKAVSVDLGCFENPEFYNCYVKALAEVSQRALRTLDNICDLIVNVITIGSIGTLIFMIDPIFVLLAVLPFAATILLGEKQNSLKYDRDMKNQEISREKDYVQRIYYSSEYAKEMRLTEMHKVMLRKMHETVLRLKANVKQYGYTIMGLEYSLAIFYDVVVYFSSIFIAAYKTLVSSTMLLGDCFVVINSITNISYIIGECGRNIMAFDENSHYIDNIRNFLEYENKTPDNINGEPAGPLEKLTFRNVSFSYEGQGTETLKNISLNISAGEKIAIVGHNGAGKSTLVRLLLHFYEPTSGSVEYNGKSIDEYQISSYRKQFSTVFQDFHLFSSATIAENVMACGHLLEWQKVEAQKALQKSGIYEKVNSLPKKMDTIVGKEFDLDGAVFSVGETQKLAIARAIAKNTEIVILDEPSSALDPIAENKIFESIFENFRDKTVIYILHRLSSAILADKIYLLEEGRIIEQGTHSELIAMNGKYADMFRKQAEKYVNFEEGGIT